MLRARSAAEEPPRTRRREGGAPAGAALASMVAVATLVIERGAAAQASRPVDGAEVFAEVDPYTRGDARALEGIGYESLGPFEWMDGASTGQIEETLGEPRVLWVETAHFKLGSTLGTYFHPGDQRERARLRVELARLAGKIEDLDPPRSRLDPWLRLHLYAQRLEEQYAELQRLFGLAESDFGSAESAADDRSARLASGPYLGMPMKFTVLLTEKSSTLARFLRRYLDLEEKGTWRSRLDGGTLFLGMSAEHLRRCGYELDAALHCTLAFDLALNLVDGFRDNQYSAALWFKAGLASWFSRRIDERWAIYARGTTLLFGDDSWRWEPRVSGLVSNGVAIPWSRTLDWTSWEEIDAQAHMVVWSRVAWMLSREDADRRRFLEAMTESLVPVPEAERASTSRARQIAALLACFGGTPEELDEEWGEFARESAPGK